MTGPADGRADHQTETPHWLKTPVYLGNLINYGLRDGSAVRRDGMLDGGSLRIGRERQNENSGAVPGREIERRLQRSHPEVRTESNRVSTKSALRIQVSACVRGHRRADIAALHIQKDKRTGLSGLSDS